MPPPPNKNALDKNDKLEDEKREMPIKVAFAQKAASNHSIKFRELCVDPGHFATMSSIL